MKAGDTLSKIAREHLGDGNAYMKIFNDNKDQLTDPDKIKPGQVLKLPVYRHLSQPGRGAARPRPTPRIRVPLLRFASKARIALAPLAFGGVQD